MPEGLAAATEPATVRLEQLEDGIACLRLDRPQVLNALTDGMVAAFAAALDQAAADTALRALLVTGSGRGFCAGFDLSLADDAPGSATLGEARAWTLRQEAFASLVTRLRALPVPVIAAVNGTAQGAGLGLALAADIRLAAAAASFSAAFVRVGMSSCDIGVSWLLPRCIGMSRAFELMLTGRTVDAPEAERIGLVARTVADADLMGDALQTARLIREHSAFGVWMTKRGAWANLETPSLQAALELENRTQILARTTGELARAAQALQARKTSSLGGPQPSTAA